MLIQNSNFKFQISFFIALLLFVRYSSAQHYMLPENLPKYDRSPYHFGFILGVNSMNYSIRNVANIKQFDSLKTIESEPQLGFTIGIVSNLRLGNDYADLRFVPSLSFGARTLLYSIKQNRILVTDFKPTESSRLEFPFDIKLKSQRFWNNYRAYVLGGVMYSIDLASQAKQKQQEGLYVIKLVRYDYSFDVGVGFDIYTTFFKFGIDLRMEYGLKDLIKRDNTFYTQGIDKLNSKIFLLSFTFE